MAKPLNILLFDIETSPLRSYHWRVWKENIGKDQLINYSMMLTWAAKWYDQGKHLTTVAALTPSEIREEDDSRIVEALASLVREADIIIGHNVDGFDRPVLNTRVAHHGLENLGVHTTIDTLKYARREFNFPHNNLDALARFFGVSRKERVDFELWDRVMQGDVKAIREMTQYNRQDVIVLEEVFDRMRPYVRRLTRLFDPGFKDEHACPFCGAVDNFQKRGFYRTQSGNFIKLQCQTCMRYTRRRNTVNRFDVHPL